MDVPQSKLNPDKLGHPSFLPFELSIFAEFCPSFLSRFSLTFECRANELPLRLTSDSEGFLRREGHRPAEPPPRLQHRLTANSETMHSFTYPSLQMIWFH